MRNPTKKQIQKVIDVFAIVLPIANKMDKTDFKCSMAMSTYEVAPPQCQTPMCHGGWYASAYMIKNKKILFSYEQGANLMAKDLGFENYKQLETWASENPKLWGNKFGSSMFLMTHAFNFRNFLTLKKIVNHWEKVQKRLPK